MLAVTEQTNRKPTCPCYWNPKNIATDVAFEGAARTGAAESETWASRLFLRSLKLQLSSTPWYHSITKHRPAAHEPLG